MLAIVLGAQQHSNDACSLTGIEIDCEQSCDLVLSKRLWFGPPVLADGVRLSAGGHGGPCGARETGDIRAQRAR